MLVIKFNCTNKYILEFIMKKDYSIQGLSEILQQSDREQHQNARLQLAKLNNLQYLSQYVHLYPINTIYDNHRHLLKVPISPVYQKFGQNQTDRIVATKKQLLEGMKQIKLKQKAVLTKEELKQFASKKLQEHSQREKLSTSRNEKRSMYFQMFKTSRGFNSQYFSNESVIEKEKEDGAKIARQERTAQSKKDMLTQQTIEDLFLRLDAIGSERDIIKKKWYTWGEQCAQSERQQIIGSWDKIYSLMKELLQETLQRLSQRVGSAEIFRQLRIENNSILREPLKGKKSKTLVSTGIFQSPSKQQTKLIVRFSQWFNKLLLDQRQLDYIHVEYR